MVVAAFLSGSEVGLAGVNGGDMSVTRLAAWQDIPGGCWVVLLGSLRG